MTCKKCRALVSPNAIFCKNCGNKIISPVGDDFVNYYIILGVTSDSSILEIKRSYRKLAHIYHPDKSGGNEQKFKEINEAYHALSDKMRRAEYDARIRYSQNEGHHGANKFTSESPETYKKEKKSEKIFIFTGGLGIFLIAIALIFLKLFDSPHIVEKKTGESPPLDPDINKATSTVPFRDGTNPPIVDREKKEQISVSQKFESVVQKKIYKKKANDQSVNKLNRKKEESSSLSIQQTTANKAYSALINEGLTHEEAIQYAKQYAGVAPTIQPLAKESGDVTLTAKERLYRMAMKYTSPELFAMMVRELPIEELRKLFPGTADENLPIGSLSEQLDKLSETLKKEKDLKFWEDKMIKQAELGKTLIPDTEAYIRDKDEYIKNIDKMINDAQEKLIPVSNPERKKEIVDYIDYLNTLKGRRNQSYTAYLNANIEAYNKETDKIDYEYKKAVDDYNNEFQRKQVITAERYNKWSKVLEGEWKYIHRQK